MIKKNIYTDLDLSFEKHPLTGDIIKATDVEAIKKSLKNLILTNLYEVPFSPEKGTSLKNLLFENFTPLVVEFLKTKINEVVERFEPRVDIKKIDIVQKADRNFLEVSIYYKIVELNKLEEITIFVEKTR